MPPNPGVVSALGLLFADYVKVYGATRRLVLDDAAPDVLRHEHARLSRAAAAEFEALGLGGEVEHQLEADMRFVGQAFEIPVAVDTAHIGSLRPDQLASQFAEAHRRIYLHAGEPGRRAEIVGLRFSVRRRLEDLPRTRERPAGLDRPPTGTVLTGGEAVQAAIVEAAQVGAAPVPGPALIEGYSSVTWVPPGWHAARDDAGNLLMHRGEPA